MKGQGRGAAALLRPAQVCREARCQSCKLVGGGGSKEVGIGVDGHKAREPGTRGATYVQRGPR